jgi:carbonic anhydrase
MGHSCDALVVSCIDFRFQKYIHHWLDTNFKNKTYDYVGFGGATKELNQILKQLEISVKLHEIKQVIVMHHENCGAYGVESIPENHTRDLRKAKQTILEKYPHLAISLYYIHLDGTFEEVQ